MCKLYGSGTHRCRDKKEHQFIAMEARARAHARERPACCVAARLTAACAPQLVGSTLAELRKAREPQRFTRATTCAVRPPPLAAGAAARGVADARAAPLRAGGRAHARRVARTPQQRVRLLRGMPRHRRRAGTPRRAGAQR